MLDLAHALDHEAVDALSEDEDTMQTYVNAEWHRRFMQRSQTACGVEYNSQFAPLRRESLIGPLCGNCFSIFELAEASRLKNESERDVY